MKMTELSRAQSTRLIGQHLGTGDITAKAYRRRPALPERLHTSRYCVAD